MLKNLESIIKSYSFITEEGADKFQFFIIKQVDEITFDICTKIRTLKELRELAKTFTKEDLKIKKYDSRLITRYLTAIVEVANNE